MELTDYEFSRINHGLAGTRGYYGRCFAIAKRLFLSGHSLDHAITKAREHFAF